jgi:predicted Rossmann fold nucleotide-binding protein DprA/Smf involved in DNA uptake
MCVIVPVIIVMIIDDLWPAHIVLIALYLRGAPRPYDPPRRAWPGVLLEMRESGASLPKAEACLRSAGYWAEAGILSASALLLWSEAHAPHIITPLSEAYPPRWRAIGASAPPAAWSRGRPPMASLFGIVGSRRVGPRVAGFAREVGSEVVRAGLGVVSGGAEGCDTFGLRGALRSDGQAVRILPCGLDLVAPGGAFDISLCAPTEPFSTANAMERNALIYAAAEITLVVHARYREGGTWHGATDALRRRLGHIAVRDDPTSPAHRALVALGATPVSSPAQVCAIHPASTDLGGLFARV